MKKILSIILVAVMICSVAFAFVGCNGEENTQDDKDKTKETFKVGAVYIGGQNDTAGYTYAHNKGITSAISQLKNEGYDIELRIQDNVAEDDTAVMNAIDILANDGCKIILGISFGYINAFAKAADMSEYSDIIFSHGTGYLSNETNFNNYFGRIYQARYLSGIAAGLKSVELGNNNIGYVSAWGTEYAETCSGINAFTLGAQSVNPNASVYVKVINTWGNESLEKQAAEELINTYKCCVIGQHCDSAQPQIAAETAGVFGCGYNSDMTVQAPKAHLTAPVWNWDVYYKLAIETAIKDPANFMSKVGNYYGGLKEGLVDISPVSSNCSATTAEKIAAAKALIINGEWDVFSGYTLSFTTNADGSCKATPVAADLCKNDGSVIVSAGSKSVEDSVITGTMNYFVAGVTNVAD